MQYMGVLRRMSIRTIREDIVLSEICNIIFVIWNAAFCRNVLHSYREISCGRHHQCIAPVYIRARSLNMRTQNQTAPQDATLHCFSRSPSRSPRYNRRACRTSSCRASRWLVACCASGLTTIDRSSQLGPQFPQVHRVSAIQGPVTLAVS